MYHSLALISSLICLASILAVYFSSFIAPRDSVLGSETLVSMLLAVFSGVLLLAGASVYSGVSALIVQGVDLTSLQGLTSLGAEGISVLILLATLVVLRQAGRRARKEMRASASVTPLVPRPTAPGNGTSAPRREAA